jgi:hypothetical protein
VRTLEPMSLGSFSDAPFRVEIPIPLAASPERAFSALADPTTWTRWFPLMHRAAWTSSTTEAVGAEREVAVRAFGQFRERFIAWESGTRCAFTMFGTTSPLIDQMAEDYRLTKSDRGSRLDWIVVARPSRIGRAATPALRVILKRIGAALGPRLDRYVSSN